jgi:hypothetical protein
MDDVHFVTIGLSTALSSIVSAGVSTIVSLWLGPLLIIRQEKARRGLEIRDEMIRALQELRRHLRNDELQNKAIESGGHKMLRWSIRDYERMLWPLVRALDNPNLPRATALRVTPLIRELLGSWRMEYLSICVTSDLENALDRYPIQPRHVDEPQSLLERLTGSELGASAPATDAIAKVEEILTLLR